MKFVTFNAHILKSSLINDLSVYFKKLIIEKQIKPKKKGENNKPRNQWIGKVGHQRTREYYIQPNANNSTT